MTEDNENPGLVIGVMLGELFLIWCLIVLIAKQKPACDRYTLAAVLAGMSVGLADVLAVCFSRQEGKLSLDSAQMLSLPALATPIFAALALRFALSGFVEYSRNKTLCFSKIGTELQKTVSTGNSPLRVESNSQDSESTDISLRSAPSLV